MNEGRVNLVSKFPKASLVFSRLSKSEQHYHSLSELRGARGQLKIPLLLPSVAAGVRHTGKITHAVLTPIRSYSALNKVVWLFRC